MKEISLHILDIAQNCISARANRITISVKEEADKGFLVIGVEDNGKGMSEDEVSQVADPFFTSRTTRRVGMGISLLRQHAEMTGGGLDLQSICGKGTIVKAGFQMMHPDKQPMGDLEGCWVLLAASNPGIEWELSLQTDAGQFEITSSEVKSLLEVDFIHGAEMTGLLKRMIRSNMEDLGFAE